MSSAGLRRVPWHLRWRTAPRAASALRIRVARLTHLHCRVEIDGSVYAGPGFRLEIPGNGTLIVGPRVQFRRGFYCEISGDGVVTIGAGSVFTADAMVQCTTSITIGERCVFAQGVLLADGAHRFRDWTRHTQEQGYDFRPLVIKDDALVLAKCTVVSDIGYRAVIAANSLVNRPVPDYTLAGGVPARALEYFGPDPAAP